MKKEKNIMRILIFLLIISLTCVCIPTVTCFATTEPVTYYDADTSITPDHNFILGYRLTLQTPKDSEKLSSIKGSISYDNNVLEFIQCKLLDLSEDTLGDAQVVGK
ncbi:MAG: hypothetical protein Q8876_05275, partial [Bacillota bacterium]|nr:hypothetical protein [Bacillota bacterium]